VTVYLIDAPYLLLLMPNRYPQTRECYRANTVTEMGRRNKLAPNV